MVDLLALVRAYVAETVQDHIWHKDSFNLAVELRGNDPFLHGNCRFGDCIDDEWLVVFLLREITRKFDGLVASVTDNDGQFLLIEAADHLPQWLNPSNSANRIFIVNGDLHIIPQPKTPSEITFIPSGAHVPLDRALHVVRTHPQLTQANTDIQQAAFEKLIDFPAKLCVNGYQWAKCWVPRNIARILKADESLIAAAVEAFYLRDPLQLKECQNMSHFHPSTNIQTSIRFTRTLYAQLVSQEFPIPPKSFRLPSQDASDFKAHDLGMKVALGFEILAVAADRNGESGETPARKSVETHSFDADPRWRTFHERLIKLGYYKGELAGSALYKTLNRVAKESHLSALESAKTQTFTDNEDEVLQDLQKEDSADSDIIVNQAAEADDAWIRLDPEELDAVLEGRFSRGLKEEDIETDGEDSDMDDDEGEDGETDQQKKLERRAEKKQVKNLEKVVAGFGAFVEKESTVDGVLFPGDLDSNEDAVLEAISDDAISDESSDDESLMDHDQNPIHIDNEKFMESLMRILSFEEEEDSEDEMLMSGKWDRAFLKQLEKIERAIEVGRKQSDGVGMDEDSASDGDESDIEDMKLEEYMAAMDKELSKSKVGRQQRPKWKLNRMEEEGIDIDSDDENDGDDDDEDALDVDANLVKNLLDSFQAQQGLPGPASNILGRMGFKLPREAV
ncbi:SGT1 protein-domain-containing protein [Chytriomyces cf. hyalinus JEL632]|nr:SGT1 protein-domain-containing protein [Chytriomyces cf. hyalinus JEL632]